MSFPLWFQLLEIVLVVFGEEFVHELVLIW